MIYNRRSVRIITAPVNAVVEVGEMKSMLNLETSTDDDLLAAFVEAATDAARQFLRRSILTETLELRMDGFPGYQDEAELRLGPGVHTVSVPFLTNGYGARVDLPFGPVASIVSITTYGRDNAASVFNAANYVADDSRVYLNEGVTWPVDLRRVDAVAIRYVSGEDVPPAAIKQAIKAHVVAMYECREGCEMPAACMAMLQPYRRFDLMGFA